MGLSDESDGSAEKALRYFRARYEEDVELLRIARLQGAFPAYELPCWYCYMEFQHQRDGHGGRSGVFCSDKCEELAAKARRPEGMDEADGEEWQVCTLEELL